MLRLQQTSLQSQIQKVKRTELPLLLLLLWQATSYQYPEVLQAMHLLEASHQSLCIVLGDEEIYHLCQCFLRFSLSRNICKCHSCLLLNVYLRIGFSNPHHSAASSHHHDKESKDHDRRDQTDQYR